MKTVYFARHAKSDWNQPGVKDFDRPLNSRGEIDSTAMAVHLQHSGFQIQKIISSDAIRALATASEYKNHLTPDTEIIRNHLLYNASYLDITEVLKSIPAEFSSVMLVGHNPGMSEVIDYYTQDGVGDMPTCSVAIIQFDVPNWNDIIISSGDLLGFEYPSGLKNKV